MGICDRNDELWWRGRSVFSGVPTHAYFVSNFPFKWLTGQRPKIKNWNCVCRSSRTIDEYSSWLYLSPAICTRLFLGMSLWHCWSRNRNSNPTRSRFSICTKGEILTWTDSILIFVTMSTSWPLSTCQIMSPNQLDIAKPRKAVSITCWLMILHL